MVSPFPKSDRHRAWGRVHRFAHRIARPASPAAARSVLAARGPLPVLPFGLGRSYGDSCLLPDGLLIETRGLDRLLAFDPRTGLLRCEAGTTLGELLATVVGRPAPDGGVWFLPVSPGTRFVTVGGAIANDVHGKNHGSAGSFGRHVRSLLLLRSDGRLRRCAPDTEPELFAATIGGLGLTGLVLEAELQLVSVASLRLECEDIRFEDLEGFYRLEAESKEWTYTVAWVDCLARGRRLGRGVFSRARHAAEPGEPVAPPGPPRLAVPLEPPLTPLNPLTLRMFNTLLFHRLGPRGRRAAQRPYDRVFYPLDAIGGWNRLYGPRGFWQYQCVLPPADAPRGIARLLETIAASGQGSFLAVLKTMGDLPSPGLLSFPMAGTTLALDFPNRGAATMELLARLDRIVLEAGGRLYPAKDGRMPAHVFRTGYPNWQRFAERVDPAFSSAFWQRVAGDAAEPGIARAA
ncbi:MAG: FAD-binding oxidoreductase [Geminicoccaceae bacterium]|nr:FAD-binding oxidoreductase [Geminicoccaceae bacterium]